VGRGRTSRNDHVGLIEVVAGQAEGPADDVSLQPVQAGAHPALGLAGVAIAGIPSALVTVHTTCTLAPNNPVLVQLACDWQISAGPRSFDAPLTGTLNWQTGNVVMNAAIATGWQQGAQVHETGHLVNPAMLEFAGTIQIQP
jgi:hypothetical protein